MTEGPLRKSTLLPTDSNIAKTALFRGIPHTPLIRVTSTPFWASSHSSSLPLPAHLAVAGPITSLFTCCYLVPHRVAIRATSISVRTGHSTQHFLAVQAHSTYHIIPLFTTIQHHSLLASTGLHTGIFVPKAVSLVYHVNPLLLLPTGCQTLTPFIFTACYLCPHSWCHSLHYEDGGSKVL